MSIPKASPERREAWCWFATELQDKTIIDRDGNVRRKQDIFDRLFVPGDPGQVELSLIVTNHHPILSLRNRADYDAAVARQQKIEEATDEVLGEVAAKLLRKAPPEYDYAGLVRLMVDGMKVILEDPRRVEHEICIRVKE